jgi:hypothetical protein
MADQPDKKTATVEVALLMPHQHGGKAYKTGDKINVTEAQAKWLRSRGVIAKNQTGVK